MSSVTIPEAIAERISAPVPLSFFKWRNKFAQARTFKQGQAYAHSSRNSLFENCKSFLLSDLADVICHSEFRREGVKNFCHLRFLIEPDINVFKRTLCVQSVNGFSI